MGTAERRLELLKYLCKARKATLHELADRFGVSIRTIQRDIYEIELTFYVPLEIRKGKYDGGVYIVGDYSFDRADMHSDELALLSKIQKLVKNQLSDQDCALLSHIIKAYPKTA